MRFTRKWGAPGGRLGCSICKPMRPFRSPECPHSWPDLQLQIAKNNRAYEEERIRAIVREELSAR